jgi:hypothetical protein
MKNMKIGILLLVISLSASAGELLTISSKAKGISAFEFEVKEVARKSNSSELLIANFQNRSAAASRWMMCAYTEIAIKRGFSFWAALYDDHSGDKVVVVFPSSESLDDPAFNEVNVGSFNPKAMPVKVFKKFCGLSDV